MEVKKLLIAICMGVFLASGLMSNESVGTLSQRQRNIVLISSYSAQGDIVNLKHTISESLDDKSLTINDIKEILIQLYAYCGLSRSINALDALAEEVKGRSKRGIKDIWGDYGKTPSDNEIDRNGYGTKIRNALTRGLNNDATKSGFVPVIGKFLKEHLYGDIFGRGVLTYSEREIITIATLASLDGVDSQLVIHINMGKNAGLNQSQISQIITLSRSSKKPLFGWGERNETTRKYFKGESYINSFSSEGISIKNITFAPKCRSNWHIHHKFGQILLVTDGRGYYQESGKPARELHKGDVVTIMPEIKHWHGAARDSWFSHISIDVTGKDAIQWLEEVGDEDYNKLK